MAKATLITEKRIQTRPNKTDGVLNYDIDNAYPNRVDDIISASGTGKLCVEYLSKFIFGQGIKDKTAYKKIMNAKGETFDQVLRKMARSMARFGGVALHFNYNANYQMTSVFVIPFKYARFTTEQNKDNTNKILIYNNWDKSIDSKIEKNDFEYFDFYNPDPMVIQKQVDAVGGWSKYKGQILYATRDGIEYPLAPCDAVLEDMQTDSHAKVFKYRNITTNFVASHIVEVDEFLDGDDTDANEQRDAFIDTLSSFQGSDEAMKLLLLEKRAGGNPIELKKVDIQNVERLYEFTENSVRDNIIRHFQIPVELLMDTSKGLGGDVIGNAYKYYNSITKEWRIFVEEILNEIEKHYKEQLTVDSEGLSIIPLEYENKSPIAPEYFQYVTQNQVLESLNLPTVEQKTANVKPLFESLGVGGLQSLIGILSDPNLSPMQKENALVIIFKLTPDEAKKLTEGSKTIQNGGVVS